MSISLHTLPVIPKRDNLCGKIASPENEKTKNIKNDIKQQSTNKVGIVLITI